MRALPKAVTTRTFLVAAVVVASAGSTLTAQPSASSSAGVPGGCNEPAAGRRAEFGCYFTGADSLKPLTEFSPPLYWHLYKYPSRSAAETARRAGGRGAVVESLGRVWLFVVADSSWRPARPVPRAPQATRMARLGPLGVPIGRPLVARYMEAVFPSGMQTAVHRHSGPEAWFVLSGAQCLETPHGIIIAKAGHGAVVPEGPPMRLSTVGAETRRAVLVVLHDAARPWAAPASDWAPAAHGGACPP